MPVVRQTPRFAGYAAANIGGSEFYLAFVQHERPTARNTQRVNVQLVETCFEAALCNHADDLQRQSVVVTFFARGFDPFGMQTGAVG